MNVNEIVELTRFIANKHQRGGAYSGPEINLALELTDVEIYNHFVDNWNPAQTLTPELRPFKVAISNGTITGGAYTLPADYNRIIGSNVLVEIDSLTRPCVVLPDHMVKRLITWPGRDLRKEPIASIRSSTIQFYPTDATNLDFEYLKLPTAPVYDYYFDSNYNEVFMAEGGAHTLGVGEEGSAGQTSGTVTSNTIEPTWDDDVHPMYASRLLAKLGVNIREADVVNYAQMKKAEE